MENVCRTCLDNRVTLMNISSEVRDPTLEQPEMKISHILSECTNRPVSQNDGQPQYICMPCVEAAQSAFRFKRQCDRSYERFWQLQKKLCSPVWKLESDQGQDQNNLEAGQEEASRADASRSYSCSPKSSRNGGASTREREPSQPRNGTKRYHAEIISERVQTKTKQIKLFNVEEKDHVCSHCHRTYKTKYNLNRHVATHVSKPKHKCHHCSKPFWRSDSFYAHLQIHDKDDPPASSHCSSVFSKADNLSMHRLEHKGEKVGGKWPVSGDLDSEDNDVDMINGGNSLDASPMRPSLVEPLPRHSSSFIREDDLRMHKILNHHTRDKNVEKSTTLLSDTLGLPNLDVSLESIKVDYSSIESSDDNPISKQNESGFDQDTASSGQGQKTFMKRFGCTYCQRSYTDKKHMERHLATHTSKPKYTCDYCSQAFWRKYRYIRHLRTHEEERPAVLSCSQCTAVFIDSIQLERHRREHIEKTVGSIFRVPDDGDSKDNDDDSEDNDEDSENNGETRLDASPKSHSLLKPEWEPQSLKSSDDSSIESSDDHQTSRQHESRFDHDTTSPGQEEKHIKVYSTEKRLECKLCSRTYKNKRGMQRHMETHSKPKHICPQCPRAFHRSDYLMRHLRTHSSPDCTYTCNQCSAEFTHRHSLSRHYRNLHQTRNSVKCNYCSKEYLTKESLKRHERVHSGELFYCRFCPKGFMERSLLRRHEKKLHKTEINEQKVFDQTGGT